MLAYFKLPLLCLLVLFLSCADDPPLIDYEQNNQTENENTEPIDSTSTTEPVDTFDYSNKVNGVSFVSPPEEFPQEYMSDINAAVGGDWIAISPFGFSYNNNDPQVLFNTSGQWWGERVEGVLAIAEYAQAHDLKVMIKPQVWIPSGGWVGNYEALDEGGWAAWEKDYRNFITLFAEVAQQVDAEIFCVGTEYKIAAVTRPQYWSALITEVRTIFDGELVYAANWDNYENIPFWDELDYIGVDSYFPLVDADTPEVPALLEAWQPLSQKLESVSQQYGKQILFTEYGYLSVDGSGWQNWVLEQDLNSYAINMQAQANCLEAFYQQFWHKEWVAGGFIWKWYHDHENSGGLNNRDYTPQNKPCEEVMLRYYN